jgi:hypothetical protein
MLGIREGESGGVKTYHGSGGKIPLRAAENPVTYFPSVTMQEG